MTSTPTIGQMLPPENRVELMQRILTPHEPSFRARVERMKWRDLLPEWLTGFFVPSNKIDGYFWR